MSSQRANYLRKIAAKRRCPRCHVGTIITNRIEVTELGEVGPVYIDGRTYCRRCGYAATGPGRTGVITIPIKRGTSAVATAKVFAAQFPGHEIRIRNAR